MSVFFLAPEGPVCPGEKQGGLDVQGQAVLAADDDGDQDGGAAALGICRIDRKGTHVRFFPCAGGSGLV